MKQKVLLLEDDYQLRENTAELLTLYNYEVYSAKDGTSGYELALLVKPHIILCDILMPEMDGFSFLKTIRANPIFHQTYFIFFSGKAQKNDVQKGLASGAHDYLIKPFTEEDLLSCFRKYKNESFYSN